MLSDQPLLGAIAQSSSNPIPEDGDGTIRILPALMSSFPFRYPFVPDQGVVLQQQSTVNQGATVQVVGAGSNTSPMLILSAGTWEIWVFLSAFASVAVAPGQTMCQIGLMDSTSTQIANLGTKHLTQLNVEGTIQLQGLIIASRIPFRIHASVYSAAGCTVTGAGNGHAWRLL